MKGVPYLTTFICGLTAVCWFSGLIVIQLLTICEQLLLGNNTASSPLCVAVHILYYGIFYFLNIIQYHSTRINVILIMPVK